MAIDTKRLSKFLVSWNEKEEERKKKEETAREENSLAARYARLRKQREEKVAQNAARAEQEAALAKEREAALAKEREVAAQEQNNDSWFKAGAFEDGYQFGDIVKTILGTVGDVSVNATKGAGSLVEGVTDLLGYGGAWVADLFGADEFASDWKKEIQKNTVDAIFEPVESFVDQGSLLGGRSDAVTQGLGQMAGILLTAGAGGAALGGAGATALTTGVTAASGMGSGMSEAYQAGATDGEALAYGAIAGAAEAATELIFGGMGKAFKGVAGLGKGLSSADDMLAKTLTSKISNKLIKNITQAGIKASAEGMEEVISGFVQAVGKKATYMSEEDFGKIIEDERLFDQFITGAITSGIAQSGIVPGMRDGSIIESTKAGRDLVTGLSDAEQKVVDREVADRVAEAKKSGEVTKKQESAIYDAVLEDMEKGYISTETIEKVLGNDALSRYDLLSKEAEEFKTLYETEGGKLSEKQKDRLAELKAKNTDTPYEKLLQSEREKISRDVSELVKNDRLSESYREYNRSGEAFQEDVSRYKNPAARQTVQNAISNGMNNTRKAHEFVDALARLSEQTGVSYDFTDNQRLKDGGYKVDGAVINGYVTKNGITINLNSRKALNSVVGHEVTHLLEGDAQQFDALKQAMKKFVETKGRGTWDKLLAQTSETYKNVEGVNAENELVADLVGDYLFTDKAFVESLTQEDPGLAKRIYQKIKSLCEIFTGTQQSKQLEQVKQTFRDAFRATKNLAQQDGVRYSLGNLNAQNDITANYQKTVDSILQGTHTDTSSVLLGYTPDVYKKLGMPSLPFVIGPGHIYSTVRTEAEARLENRYSKKMHYHGLGDNAVKNIYTAAQDPLMIIASKDVNQRTTPLRSTHSVVAIIDVGIDSQHLLLPVEITAKRTVNGEEMDVNVLSSAYNKNVSELVREAVALENIGEVGVYYIKKGATLPADSGVQFPVHLSNKIASDGIVHNFSEKVNMNISDATQSQQFKRWFGDWQNHPENASKIVNSDGTPKVVYHGSTEKFTTFSYGHIGSATGVGILGDGFYFTDQKRLAEDYGKNVLPVYLQMKNPYIATESDAYKLRVEDIRQQGFDGVILRAPQGDVYMVFENTQIKSATDNIGTFDGNNPDIRYSLSSEREEATQDGWQVAGEDVALGQEIVTDASRPRNDGRVAEDLAPTAEDLVAVDEELAPTEEDVAQQKAEDALYGPWRMKDPLDMRVEKLWRMMLREKISEQEYVAQLVKADRLYQQRGEYVEAALERVREAYRRRPETDADSDVMTMSPETETKMTRLTRKVLHTNIMEKIREKLAAAGFDMDELLGKAKRLSTFATVDNTPQRVIEKTFGYKAGQVINDLTVNKVALNESEGIQWLNDRVAAIKSLSKKYGIKPGSKESRAAQIYGEGFWVNEAGEYIQYGDMELAADFPDAKKQENIKKLAKDPEVRKMYDETLEAINEARVRNGYPPIPKRADYFLHFRAQTDTFSRLGVPFNPNDIKAKDLPTDLNGMTADLKPGKPFFASEMRRKGDKTTYDLLGGLERYMNSAKNQIYHIDDIQTFRAFRNYVADMFGQENGLSDLDSLSPEEQEIRIKEVFDGHLSTFAKFLNEEANVLAGKTALIDRGIEGVLGRRAIQFVHEVNSQVGKNMVGWNVSSAGTNVLPVIQAMAKLPKVDMVRAFAQTVSNKFRNDGFVESDPALIRRRGADQFDKKFWQKLSDSGYALMSAVDNLASEVIVRAKYNELVRKNKMDSKEAHIRAGEWASRLMGDRSLGQMPQLYNSKTLGLITKFQLEVRNQLDAMGYDTIQEAKAEDTSSAKKAAKIASTMAQLAIFQHLFGQAYESIAGYNPTFDIIENLIKLFGFDDDEESEDTFGDNLEQAFQGLLEDLPYTSTLTGGRIPIESALPVEEFITGKDDYGNEKSRLETIGEALPYYFLPGGYGQFKKTKAGLHMFDDDFPVAGSYTDSGNLRFPVEDTVGNRIQAGIFGQYASENARDYFDNGWAPLQEKQIEEFAALGIPVTDYRKIRTQLGKLGTVAEKFDYIDSLDLSVEQKNILINNAVNRKEPVDMTDYGLYEDYEEFDFYIQNPEKYQFLKDNDIEYRDYNASEESRAAYNWAFQNPEKFEVSRAVSGDIVAYKSYTKALSEIKADKNADGNAISGTRKNKVIQYLNGLDAEYGAKLILYKMEYPSDDSYNVKIVEYINSLADFSYGQKETVLKELGFKVDAKGNISW